MLTAEQIEIRKKGIGSSEIASVAGLNPFKGAYELWLEKTEKVEPSSGNTATRRGEALEPLIGQLYAEYFDVELEPGNTILDGWRVATPDFICNKNLGNKPYLVEAKAPANSNGWGESFSQEAPEYYVVQLQWQMDVSGIRNTSALAALLGNECRFYPFDFDAELVEMLNEIGYKFWHNHVLKDVPPEIDGSEGATRYLHKRFETNYGNLLAPTDETMRWAERLREVRAEMKALEASKLKLENLIKNAIGEADGIDGIATWKSPKDSEKVDWKAIAKELGADDKLIAKHTTIKTNTRRFLLKEAK